MSYPIFSHYFKVTDRLSLATLYIVIGAPINLIMIIDQSSTNLMAHQKAIIH